MLSSLFVEQCMPKESNNLYRISCSNETDKVSCQRATNFILLTVRCRNNERNFEELICYAGKWIGKLPNCQRKEKYTGRNYQSDHEDQLKISFWFFQVDECGMEVLGEESVRPLESIVNNLVHPKVMPWNVIIKKKYQGIYNVICGGTLISENAIITGT